MFLVILMFTFSFLTKIFPLPGICRVQTLAVDADEVLCITVLRWVAVLGKFRTGKSATAGVRAMPEPLALQTAVQVWNVGSDIAANKTYISLL